MCCLLTVGCTTPAAAPEAPATPALRPNPTGSPLPGLVLQALAEGLNSPVYVTHAGDGSSRLFIVEQDGRIRVVQDGRLKETPFLDLTAQVSRSHPERGLLGLAFHPRYAQNGVLIVHYTGRTGATVVARYRVSGTDPDRADPDSGQVLLTLPQPYPNHNGGGILFGPDGYLYIALGDGGSAGDPQNNAQNPESLLGKLLRIDADGPAPYGIPPDNPFAGKPGRDEIWAYGLRNPWRFSVDRATGDLYIGDVGQNQTEEINFQPRSSQGGQNYGWRIYEGRSRYKDDSRPETVFPIAEYDHSLGCSVTGGYVYRGQAVPALTGTYLYGDYCSGRIWGLRRDGADWAAGQLLDTDLAITSFGEDEAGELYVVHHRGAVYRLAAGPSGPALSPDR